MYAPLFNFLSILINTIGGLIGLTLMLGFLGVVIITAVIVGIVAFIVLFVPRLFGYDTSRWI